jgi:hypothetical protein
MGYEERNRRMKNKFEEKKRINDAREQKMKEDLAILETKNALKLTSNIKDFIPLKISYH